MNIRKITSALALSLAFSAVALAQNANTAPAADTAAADKAKTDNVDNWFGRFDYNKDGKVTLEEFGLGKTYFKALDLDSDGALTREEAKQALLKKSTVPDLRAMDTDKDGYVTRREWTGDQAGFDELDKDNDGVLSAKDRQLARSEAKAKKRLEAFDKNKDGVLTQDEWPADASSFRKQDLNRNGVLTVDELGDHITDRH